MSLTSASSRVAEDGPMPCRFIRVEPVSTTSCLIAVPKALERWWIVCGPHGGHRLPPMLAHAAARTSRGGTWPVRFRTMSGSGRGGGLRGPRQVQPSAPVSAAIFFATSSRDKASPVVSPERAPSSGLRMMMTCQPDRRRPTGTSCLGRSGMHLPGKGALSIEVAAQPPGQAAGCRPERVQKGQEWHGCRASDFDTVLTGGGGCHRSLGMAKLSNGLTRRVQLMVLDRQTCAPGSPGRAARPRFADSGS